MLFRSLGIIWKGKYKGQKQKWFLMRFIGNDSEINIKTKNPEFLDWKWIDLEKAINSEYEEWQDTAEECVALVILLDQFSRNLFRDNPKAFEQDYKTRLIVNEGVDRGYLEELSQTKIHFFLMPLIHSEDLSDHIFGHNLIDTYLKTYKYIYIFLLFNLFNVMKINLLYYS